MEKALFIKRKQTILQVPGNIAVSQELYPKSTYSNHYNDSPLFQQTSAQMLCLGITCHYTQWFHEKSGSFTVPW